MDNIKAINIALAERIKTARHRSSPPIDSNELAHIIGVNKSTISRIESGKIIPSVKTLLLISTALNTTISKLMSGLTLKIDDGIES